MDSRKIFRSVKRNVFIIFKYKNLHFIFCTFIFLLLFFLNADIKTYFTV